MQSGERSTSTGLSEERASVIHRLGVARVRGRRFPVKRLPGSDGFGLRLAVDTAVAQAATSAGSFAVVQLSSTSGPICGGGPPLTSSNDDVLYMVDDRMCGHSSTLHSHLRNVLSSNASNDDPEKPWLSESRESILAKRRARRLTERLAKPSYVNTDACCRFGRAALAYESARMGKRAELVSCSDSALAEHLALLMAMHDAERQLAGRVVFRVGSAAVVSELRRDRSDLVDVKQQINELLLRYPDWSLVLVDRGGNKQAHHLAKRTLREG